MKKLIGILIAVIILLSGIVVYLVVTKDNNIAENPSGNNQQEEPTPEQIDYTSYVPSDGAYIKTVTRTKEINGKTEKLTVVIYMTDEGLSDKEHAVEGVVLLNDQIIMEKIQLDLIDENRTINNIKNESYDKEIVLTTIKDTKNNDEYVLIDILGGNYVSFSYIMVFDKNGNTLLHETMGGSGVNLPNGERYAAGEFKNNKIYDIGCSGNGMTLDIIEIEDGKVVKNSTTYPGNYFEGGAC